MKKHLIAAAVAAAVAAPAMAQNVTLSGNMDMGIAKFDASSPGGIHDKTFYGNGGGSSTPTFAINANEDLGGGMRVAFQLGNDLAAGASSASSVIAAGQSFLALTQNGVGTVRFGNVNTGQLAAALASQPFATAIGSGFSGNFGRQSLLGINGTVGASATAGAAGVENGFFQLSNGTAGSGARIVRANSTLSLETDTFNGFSASYSAIAKNGDTGEAVATNGAQEITLKYSGMGLNIVAAQYVFKAGAAAATGGGLIANEEVKHMLVGANYALTSSLTLMGGLGTTKSNQAGRADSSNNNVAIRYLVAPSVALLANHVSVNDKLNGNVDRKLTGLGVDYLLSKRSTVYLRYETGDHNRANETGKFTNVAAGLRHSF